jgi:protein-S-isoprenylcysteine O-methyltransferase Ste14
MSLVPEFGIGIWNAWIFSIVYTLLVYIPTLISKDYSKKMGQGEHYGKPEILMTVICYILMIFPVVLPLKLGTLWFYVGLAIYLLGLFISAIAIQNVVSTPPGKPFVKGIYRYSRNPGYLGQIIVYAGIGIASASWLYLLLTLILIIATFSLISVEEWVTLEKFGESYRQYMNKTPRWIGISKIGKSK